MMKKIISGIAAMSVALAMACAYGQEEESEAAASFRNFVTRSAFGGAFAGMAKNVHSTGDAIKFNALQNAAESVISQDEAMRRARAGASNVSVNVGSGQTGAEIVQQNIHDGEKSFAYSVWEDKNNDGKCEEGEFAKKQHWSSGEHIRIASCWENRSGSAIEIYVRDSLGRVVYKDETTITNNNQRYINPFYLPSNIFRSDSERFSVEYFADGRRVPWQDTSFEVSYDGFSIQGFVVKWEDTNKSGKPDEGDRMSVFEGDNIVVRNGEFFLVVLGKNLGGEKIEHYVVSDHLIPQGEKNVAERLGEKKETNYSGRSFVDYLLPVKMQDDKYRYTIVAYNKDGKEIIKGNEVRFKVDNSAKNTDKSWLEKKLAESAVK